MWAKIKHFAKEKNFLLLKREEREEPTTERQQFLISDVTDTAKTIYKAFRFQFCKLVSINNILFISLFIIFTRQNLNKKSLVFVVLKKIIFNSKINKSIFISFLIYT